MKRANPMPTGAIKFPVRFSAANMKIVKTSKVVSSISMSTPYAILVSGASVIEPFRPPAKRADTRNAPAIAPGPPSVACFSATIRGGCVLSKLRKK